MANRSQKLLFNLSTIAPIAFFAVVVWWIQCGKSEIIQENSTVHITTKAIIISAIGIIGLMLSFYSVIVVKLSKRTEIVPINVASVTSKDGMAVGAIVSYILPFASFAFEDINLGVSLAVAFIALVALVLTNTVWPNPVLLLWKYHFYEVSTENGSNELPLISQRKSIQDAKTITMVKTLWDYFLIEVEE